MTSLSMADKIAKAVLYEGYLLYPYTRNAIKNRQRWTFGGLYPRKFVEKRPGSDLSEIRSEVLLEGNGSTSLSVRLRFLHLISRTTRCFSGSEATLHEASGQNSLDEWEEAAEEERPFGAWSLDRLVSNPFLENFQIPGATQTEQVLDSSGQAQAELIRIRAPLYGRIEVSAQKLSKNGLFKITVKLKNSSDTGTDIRKVALLNSFISTHLLISTPNGKFVSMFDPPEPFLDAHAQCKNEGTWPILLGQPGDRDLMMSSPIILYDHPQIAPESPGDLFDGGEIDEILSLRILTLTDAEKDQIRAADEKGRAMLERTERLSEEDLLRMHGSWRDTHGRPHQKPQSVRVGETELKKGSRVRIRPKKSTKNSADVFDIVLSGMDATVQSVEQDFEGNYLLSVAIDDDPGRDIDMKAQLGHRFFFKPEDLELL